MEVGKHVAVDVGVCAAGVGGGIEAQLLWRWYYISVLLASTGRYSTGGRILTHPSSVAFLSQMRNIELLLLELDMLVGLWWA